MDSGKIKSYITSYFTREEPGYSHKRIKEKPKFNSLKFLLLNVQVKFIILCGSMEPDNGVAPDLSSPISRFFLLLRQASFDFYCCWQWSVHATGIPKCQLLHCNCTFIISISWFLFRDSNSVTQYQVSTSLIELFLFHPGASTLAEAGNSPRTGFSCC